MPCTGAWAALTGPDGLLKAMTKAVLATTLDEEMTDQLGYDRHDFLLRTFSWSRLKKLSNYWLSLVVDSGSAGA